jgi:predicted glycosyltransferase
MFWFDLDNSPHVLIFRPIFNELKNREIEYLITARDFAQTKKLLELWDIKHTLIGKHGGKNKIRKVLNLFHRSLEVKRFIKGKNIKTAISHGSRTQISAAKYLGLKTLVMLDYEYTENRIFNYLSDYILFPAIIPDSRLKKAGFNLKKIIRYNGIKEEIYLQYFNPDPEFRKKIGVKDDEILITIRPPALSSNYHNEKSEQFLIESIKHFTTFENVQILITSRTSSDKNHILKNVPENKKFRFLDKPVDGLQLLYSSDITVSGGGTMNRESALLGTDTYSIFTGKKPFIDEYLFEKKMLNFIDKVEDIYNIDVKRKPKGVFIPINNFLSRDIVDIFINV